MLSRTKHNVPFTKISHGSPPDVLLKRIKELEEDNAWLNKKLQDLQAELFRQQRAASERLASSAPVPA